MDEDHVTRLLEEIRDLQRRQVEAYERALGNQQEAMRLQREGVGRVRKLLIGLGVAIIIVLGIVLVLLRYVLQHYT
ncbi:MAG: hypothetical protein H7247_16210 [Polaromonas sp.]|nr:hypothetical protein [Gemmatimonadaceae bacterium]